MANKKVSQLVSKPSVLVTDLFPIADPTTGQLFKTTISDLGTAIGSGVSSVNTLVGAVVLDTDDIQELASPTNRWFTDTRARAALSASSPLAYNSGTGVFSIAQANGSTNGFLSSTDWTTFNAKQAALSGTGFVKISGTTISYDNSTYLTTSAAASTYLALAGGTLTGALNGTSATFTGDLTLSATNPRLYFTDTDNNPDYFISNTDGTFTIYDVTNSTSRFTIGTTGNGTFGGNLTVGQIIRSGGTSSQFLKADGSVDSSTYLTTATASSTYVPYTGATGAIDLGANNLTSKNLIINGAGSTFRQLSFYTSGSPRWSIYASNLPETGSNAGSDFVITKTDDDGITTNPVFTISRATGNSQVNYSFSITTLNTAGIMTNTSAGLLGTSAGTGFIKMNGGVVSYDNSTYLTTSSASSTYLPLAGGILTGGLSGTSASFSSTLNATGNLTIGNAVAGTNVKIILNGVASKAAGFEFHQSGTPQWYLGNGIASEDNNFELYNSNGTMAMKIIKSTNAINFTGAASFSTSITTGSASVSSDILVSLSTDTGAFAIKNVRASHSFSIYDHQAGVDRLWITSSGNVGIGTTSPGDKFYVTSSGFNVATFNSTYGQMSITFANSGTGFAALGSGNSVCSTASADDLGFGTAGLNKNIVFATGASYLERMRIKSSGIINFSNVPTSSAGLSSGDIYKSAGVLMIV